MVFKIYLIGSAPKSDEALQQFNDWRVPYLKHLRDVLGDVVLLDFNNIHESAGAMNVFGHDCHLVEKADAVVANAEAKIGAGTAMEMLIAKYFKKPLITILPKDTHHRRSNVVSGGITMPDWIHPFIYSVSDAIAENTQEAAQLVKQHLTPDASIKDITIIDRAIKQFNDFIQSS